MLTFKYLIAVTLIVPTTISFKVNPKFGVFPTWTKVISASAAGVALISLNQPEAGSAQTSEIIVQQNEATTAETKNEVTVDIWRETNLRFMGYANEVGESIGVVYPRYIGPSYVVAFGYVGGDALDKAWKSYEAGDPASEIV